jgi:hypothetical protein
MANVKPTSVGVEQKHVPELAAHCDVCGHTDPVLPPIEQFVTQSCSFATHLVGSFGHDAWPLGHMRHVHGVLLQMKFIDSSPYASSSRPQKY